MQNDTRKVLENSASQKGKTLTVLFKNDKHSNLQVGQIPTIEAPEFQGDNNFEAETMPNGTRQPARYGVAVK